MLEHLHRTTITKSPLEDLYDDDDDDDMNGGLLLGIDTNISDNNNNDSLQIKRD